MAWTGRWIVTVRFVRLGPKRSVPSVGAAGGVDARHAKAALAMQVNKTDANDALGLAQIVRTGWYREVQVKSERSHRTRGLLAARSKLVDMRKEVTNQLRGLLKVFGHVIGPAGGEKFDARARELAAGDETLSTTAEALLAARTALGEQVARLDKLLLAQARQDPACRRLMTVPSTGHPTGAVRPGPGTPRRR
jgi:transposase